SFRKAEGKHELNDKTSSYNLGVAAYARCDFRSARIYFELALNEAKQAGNKYIEGRAYNSLGMAYDRLGDHKKAIEFYQQSLSIAKEIGNKGSEGKAYGNLGNAYLSLCNYKKAIEFYQQSLTIAKKIGEKNTEGSLYGNLGSAYDLLGDCKKAIEFHQQSLSIAKEIGNKVSKGAAYSNLGIAYRCLGDHKKAIEFHQQSLSIAKEIGNKGSEGKAYGNLGNAYQSLGNYKKAIEFYQQSLTIAKRTGEKNTEGSLYGNLGNSYGLLSDYKKAIEFYQQSLSIAKEIGHKGSEARAYCSLGNAYHSLGNYKKGIEFYQQSLTIAKEIGEKNTEGSVYDNLGSAYFLLGDCKKAIEFHQQSLSIAKEIGNKGSEGAAYTNLGRAYRSLGNYKKGIEFHQQCLSFAKEMGNKGLEGTAYAHLGSAYHRLGDHKKAIEFHQQSLSIAKETGKKGLEQCAYNNLGLIFEKLRDFRKAEGCFESSIKVFEEMRFLLQEKDEWKISFRDKLKTYSCLWISQLRQGKTKEALLTAERGRAQALADLMESQYGAKSTPSASKEQIERITNISSVISSPTTFLAEAFESVFFWVLQKDQEWQFIMGRKLSYTLEDMTDKAFEQIRATKPARCEDRSLDYPDNESIEDLSDRDANEKEFTSLQAGGDALKELYDVVIAPISPLLKDEELIIVPDGALFLIPYAALLDQNSRYLSETLRVRLAPSLTSLRLLSECPEGRHCTSGALLVGDPWIETVRLKSGEKLIRYFQLPGAEEEVKMIGQILNVEPLTGKDATKEQVLSRLKSVSLVHIAAHGSEERGEILLSPNLGSSEPPEEKDFLFTMTDMLDVKLNAKLVILSCCHSGRGEVKAEGVVGIARAFLGAGARSVIASLWAIDDEATLAFMRHFYEHLVKGQSASKSLHEAMKMMRESDDFNAVKYWAPFMLIGDDVTLNFDQ
ncbi:unnamed protein product, partial [Porites evermanni]